MNLRTSDWQNLFTFLEYQQQATNTVLIYWTNQITNQPKILYDELENRFIHLALSVWIKIHLKEIDNLAGKYIAFFW